MAKISYNRQVLISTKQYENTRVEFGVTDAELKRGESLEQGYSRIAKEVDLILLKKVMEIKFGETIYNEVQKRNRFLEMAGTQIAKLGLNISKDDIAKLM